MLFKDNFRIMGRRPIKQRFWLTLEVFIEECDYVRINDLMRSLAPDRATTEARYEHR